MPLKRIPGESCKDPKVLNNAMRIEELRKSEVALARKRDMKKKKPENLKILLIKMKML